MNFTPLFPVKMLLFVFTFMLMSCSNARDDIDNNRLEEDSAPTAIELKVFKSRTCGCCQKWIDHVEDNGFETNVNNITFLNDLKEKKGIAPNYRSCHTAESKNGYIFEGHVPAKYIKQYLSKVPAGTIGLSVPAMPVGTPGMEMDDRFMPYHILLLNTDGTSSIYAEVATYKEQF